MPTRYEYTTISELRASYLASTQTTDDALILQMIRAACRMINEIGNKAYFPLVATRYFDIPRSRELDFGGDWLLSLTTLTNGAAGAVSSSDYFLVPRNGDTHYALSLTETAGEVWQLDTNGNAENAIAVTGVWGYVPPDCDQWISTGGVLTAAIVSTTATTFACTTGTIKAGYLLKIDSEYLYAVSISTGATDTVTCERGVNGSTAATRAICSIASPGVQR